MSGDDWIGHLDEAFQIALFRALARGTESFVSCIDRRRRVLFINRTLSRDASELAGKPIEAFVAPAEREATIGFVERAFTSGEPQHRECEVVLADGSKRWMSTRIFPFRGPAERDLALMLTDDVSERRRLAEELERNVEFHRRVIEHLPDYVVLVDREHRFVWLNRIAPGLPPEKVIGKIHYEFIVNPGGAEVAKAAVDAAFAAAKIGQYEIEAYGDPQSTKWYRVRVVPVMREGKVEHALLLSSDVTQRRRAEQALREAEELLQQAQRQESLGQLAGGIAHDFNNLLQIIQGNISFAQQRQPQGEACEELEQALRATERAAELTSRLLAIGRRQRVDSKPVELGALVAQSVRMLRRVIPENVLLRYEEPAEPYFVELDAPQFEQVLINLCVNARDAMPSGGTLSVCVEPDGPAQVVMRVSDSGTGIAHENLRRVFEPFFTTKGTGSGLGLAVAAGIVAAHGGFILAESDGHSGTTIKVRLPRIAASAPQAAPAALAVGAGTGVILVAEDEAPVRVQIVRVLEHAGYTVLQAENGARAVELFRAQRGNVDLAVLDVVMPELDGWQTFVQLEELKPGIKVLFTTGYAASVLPEDFAARGARLLSKPYKLQHLLGQIQELLGAAART
jgi:two-component system cell cycle sensor histidine kinase/response regulator CckA